MKIEVSHVAGPGVEIQTLTRGTFGQLLLAFTRKATLSLHCSSEWIIHRYYLILAGTHFGLLDSSCVALIKAFMSHFQSLKSYKLWGALS